MVAWRMGFMGLWLAGAAGAAPTLPPPADFAGDQYIDGAGCVHMRRDGRWTPRLDGSGAALCGFPPSLSSARIPAAEAPDPETVLVERLAEGLGQGEFAADPAPATERAPAPQPRRPDPLHGAIDSAVSLDPALRVAAGLSAPPELCAKLGYRPDPGAVSGLGLCPGMSAVTPALRPAAALSSHPAVRPAPRMAARPAVARAAADKSPGALRETPDAVKPAQPGVEMIPASARYVQVGVFADEAAEDAALRRVAGRGHPTARIRAKAADAPRVVLAGPFTDRSALVAALVDLRANGFAGAVAR